MHWRQLIRGCELYHAQERFDSRYLALPTLPYRQGIDIELADKLVRFMNSWGTRSSMKPEELLAAILGVYSELDGLRGLRIEDLDVRMLSNADREPGGAILRVFDSVAACCSKRKTATGASKILHALMPHLFMMWDEKIAGGYGLLKERTGTGYTHRFLPRVVAEMEQAIESYDTSGGPGRSEAIASLVAEGCGRSLPKILDEFNYVKFTMSSDDLWQGQ